MALLLYRGPFQGRRLRFLLDAAATVHDELELVWVDPEFDPEHPKTWARALADERPALERALEVDGAWRSAPAVMRALRRRYRRPDVLYAIGYTAIPYARALQPRRLVWVINGIPEERLLHDSSSRARAFVRAEWLAARFIARPDLAVVVSDPMGRLVEQRIGIPWVKAPTCVDIRTFGGARDDVARTFFTYVGSGAPWQGLDLLAPIWAAIADLDPNVRFRVVSRDERTSTLASAVPADRVQVLAGSAPEIARMLWEAELAFLVRSPDIVNETSFPTKFGEYVAAGVPVVSTDVGWEIADIIRRTGCGLIVDCSRAPRAVAREVLEFRDRARADPAVRQGCREAARALDRERWVSELGRSLERVLTTVAART
jgi:glycosyltransferase involved in cell wall biosynthesis